MEQAQTTTLGEIWTRKLIYPGHTFPTAIAPVAVAAGLAVHDGVFAPLPALLAFLAGWLIQFAGVVTDNYENLVREPDDREHPELVQAVRSGLVTMRGLRMTIVGCYGLAGVVGLYLAAIGGLPVVAIGLLSILASWAYSAGPLPVGRIGLADPLFFLFFGVVSVVGTYYVEAATVLPHPGLGAGMPLAAVALGLPMGALITNILIIDDIRDCDHDAVKGKNTVAVRFGPQWSRREFMLLLGFAYLVPVWFWLGLGLGGGSLMPLLTAPGAAWLARELFRRKTPRELGPMTPWAAQLAMAYAALLALGLALQPA